MSSESTHEHEYNKEKTMKALVVGATGKYASLVVPELKQRITLRPAAGMPMRLERRTHNPMTHTVS